MTESRRTAYQFRFWLLAVGLLFELAAVAWVVAPSVAQTFAYEWESVGLYGTPLCLPSDGPPGTDWYLLSGVAVIGLILLAQWGFLRPTRFFSIRLTARGRPLRSSILVAAAMAMLLTLGACSLVLEVMNRWVTLISPDDKGPSYASLVWIWVGMAMVWAVWAAVFYRYWREGDRYTQLGRVIRALVAGSILEALVAAPVHVVLARRENCYCERGSYTTLVCAGTVLFWAFGPGIVLLFLREKHRRAQLFPQCLACGYDLRGCAGACPECGANWRSTDGTVLQQPGSDAPKTL